MNSQENHSTELLLRAMGGDVQIYPPPLPKNCVCKIHPLVPWHFS